MSWSKQRLLKCRRNLHLAAASLDDEAALETPELFPAWAENHEYTAGERVRWLDLLYRCVQGHVSQAGWTPDSAPALWARVDDPAEEWPEWRQPTGAQDAYSAGAKVSHNDKHWISDADGNVWEPGVYGWTEA